MKETEIDIAIRNKKVKEARDNYYKCWTTKSAKEDIIKAISEDLNEPLKKIKNLSRRNKGFAILQSRDYGNFLDYCKHELYKKQNETNLQKRIKTQEERILIEFKNIKLFLKNNKLKVKESNTIIEKHAFNRTEKIIKGFIVSVNYNGIDYNAYGDTVESATNMLVKIIIVDQVYGNDTENTVYDEVKQYLDKLIKESN
jgi:hypothetical protein